MKDWTGQPIEILFRADTTLPRLTGTCTAVTEGGVVVETGDDGTAIAHKIVSTFVPWTAVRYVNRLADRTQEEQEAKKHELNERFKRNMMETLNAPSQQAIEALEREEID